MNFLIIGDPLRHLKPKTDTSLALAREALARSHEVSWCTPEDLYLWEGRVFARTERITECPEGTFPLTEPAAEAEPLNSFDNIWIRKDPPFDQSYLSLCWLLALEENNVPMLNKPSLLLRYHEKMLPLEAKERGFLLEEEIIPTFLPLGKRMQVPKNFPSGEAVSKPWLGHGGKDVRLLPSAQATDPLCLLQPLQKEIYRAGDRRIFMLNGEVIGSFVRMPPPGEIKSNIASGGTGLLKEMTKREREIAERVGEFLKEVGIAFAGIDMIHEKISEMNITSPTGFLTYHQIGGPRLAPLYLDFAEQQI